MVLIEEEYQVQCDPTELHAFILQCGKNLLYLTGITAGGEEYPLGNKTLDLPFYTRMVQMQKQKAMTWAEIGFDPAMSHCYPNRTYTITCGSFSGQVREDGKVRIGNLFPGREYGCDYNRNGYNQSALVDLETERFPFELVSPFISRNDGIYLPQSFLDDLGLSGTWVNTTITVTDKSTNKTNSASGDVAASHGITGLAPASMYKVCLTVAQMESYYELESHTWCYDMMTLPALSPHSGSLTGIWINLFLMIMSLLALFIILHQRIDTVRALLSDFKRNVQSRWKRLFERNNHEDIPMNA